jgi:protein-S-isoprenylcysteine O-methyltransferase Ste14
MARTGLGAEHPLNDRLQLVFLAVFLVVWGADSFVFGASTVLAQVVPLFVRLPLGALAFAVGVYLVAKSDVAVFGRTLVGRIGEPEIVTSRVYAWVRHPMYLGLLLTLLGFSLSTLSLLSLLVLAAFFAFFDRMATYEEQDLCRKLGTQYQDYKKQVPKWLPHSL